MYFILFRAIIAVAILVFQFPSCLTSNTTQLQYSFKNNDLDNLKTLSFSIQHYKDFPLNLQSGSRVPLTCTLVETVINANEHLELECSVLSVPNIENVVPTDHETSQFRIIPLILISIIPLFFYNCVSVFYRLSWFIRTHCDVSFLRLYSIISWPQFTIDDLPIPILHLILRFCKEMTYWFWSAFFEHHLKDLDTQHDFLAYLCHELRNPVHAIISLIDETKEHLDESNAIGFDEHSQLPSKQFELNNYESSLQLVRKNAYLIASILNDSMDVNRMIKGLLRNKKSPVNLRMIVQEVYQLFQPIADMKGLQMTLQVDDDVSEYISGDGERIRQIFINIIGNSVKFTHHGHIVTKIFRKRSQKSWYSFPILSKTTNESYVIEIIDTGEGIADDLLKYIRQPFSLRKLFAMSGHEGAGLGVCLVQCIVNSLNGTMTLDSVRGKGTTVRLSLTFDECAGIHDSNGKLENSSQCDKTSASPVCSRLLSPGLLSSRTPLSDLCLSFEDILEQQKRNLSSNSIPSENCDHPFSLETNEPASSPFESRKEIKYLSSPPLAPKKEIKSLFELQPLPFVSSSISSAVSSYHERKRKSTADIPTVKSCTVKLCRSKSAPTLRVYEVNSTIQPIEIKPTVLLVDDQTVNIRILQRMLQDDYKCVSATCGQEALELFRKHMHTDPFKLCLTDLVMPEMSGYQLVRELRKLENENNLQRLPIIAVSAGVVESERKEFKESEIDAFCPKPFDRQYIHTLINNVFESKSSSSNVSNSPALLSNNTSSTNLSPN